MKISYNKVWFVLFLLLLIGTSVYLHRVPGLFGDEASEGQNVYELLRAKEIVVRGERSYIGPLIDYVRVPFIALFGYTALALRLVMLAVSLGTFVLAASVFRRFFGKEFAPYAAAALFFSPAYLLEQRLGWAITLFPFFMMLTLYFLTSNLRHKALLTGVAAGLGLHNYLAFLPTIAGIGVGASLWSFSKRQSWRTWLSWSWAIVGFWAVFATQFVVIQLFPEDQGNPREVLAAAPMRFSALPQLAPLLLSGSSYVARYVGVEFSAGLQYGITILLGVGILLAFILPQKRLESWVWGIGTIVQIIVLVFMIDRFTLRYFVVPVISLWALAGLGIGKAVYAWLPRLQRLQLWLPVGVAIALTTWMGIAALLPFLRTDGSTNRFSLANRTDTAADFAATHHLFSCLRGKGPVSSDNVHIYNRLIYSAHEYPDLKVVEDKNEAHFLVEHPSMLTPETLRVAQASSLCPEVRNFIVFKRR